MPYQIEPLDLNPFVELPNANTNIFFNCNLQYQQDTQDTASFQFNLKLNPLLSVKVGEILIFTSP